MRALVNLVGLALALLVSMGAVAGMSPPYRSTSSPTVAGQHTLPMVVIEGKPALRDRTGHAVPLDHYDRIVSGSVLVDQLLLALCEPSRIVALTSHGKKESDHAIYSDNPTHPGLENLELIVGLRPDLVLTNHRGDPRPVARLRRRGVVVFDLGEMRGLSTLEEDVVVVAALLGNAERGHAYARRLRRRLEHLAEHVGPSDRREGMYVSIYGGQMFGGTRGTSYHDVLHFAGIRDIAAKRYRDWPRYTPEALLELDPELIVTGENMRDSICRHSGLRRLRACGSPVGVVQLPVDLIGDPGPRMLEAAELLHERVYDSGTGPADVDHGSRPATTTTGAGWRRSTSPMVAK